jgi:hypothetical protein
VVRRAAIQGHGQDTRDGRFSNASVAAEDIAVRRTALGKRVLQGAGNMLLADDVGELLGTVFAGKNLVTHDEEKLDYT